MPAFLLIGVEGKNLSKKSRRSKQRALNAQPPSKIIFTFPAVRMLKDALRLAEESCARSTPPLPNLELAAETIEALQLKLDAMLQREEWDRETPLDYNELRMLYAAIHMWLVHVTFEKKHTDIDVCLVLCKQFSRIIEQIDGKQLTERAVPGTPGE
jgi:hypothetical protein